MAKADKLKEKIANKREFLRGSIVLAITILSGIVVTVYKVVAKDLDVYILLFVALGIVALSINIVIVGKIYEHIDQLTEELGDV